MQLHELKLKNKPKKRKRVGRGGKRGTYSGRGMKGQKSRAGRKMPPVMRELVKRYPKLRGYKFNIKRSNIAIVNLEAIEKKFETGEKVNPQLLIDKGLVFKMKGKVPKVKILANGKITKAFNFEGCRFSDEAKNKVEKAGGKIL